jgi:hypothetical protein
MRAFLLGASLAAMLAGCAQQGELRITAIGGQETRADDGALIKAQILLSRGEHALAVDAYRKAIRHNPGNASAYNGLAIAYDQLGGHDLSRRYYELALAYAPREGKYYRNLARSLERQGLKSEAARILAQLDAGEAPALAAAPEPASFRSLAQIASEQAAALADAATGAIRPHLERLSMGEVLLETKAEAAPVMAAHSITVPIPVTVTVTSEEEPEIAARPVGHSITVEIPEAVPAPEVLADAQSVKPAAPIPQDTPLVTLTEAAPLEPAVHSPRLLLAAAAADPQALLAMAFRPVQDAPPSCDAAARPSWVSEYDIAASGTRMTVFTGDFAPMRLGGSGLAIDLPLLYPASRNLPVAADASSSASCTVRMADTPPAYDALFSTLWLDWTDEDGAA